MKVLIADDEPFVRITLSKLLKLEGHNVVAAADGQAALDSALANPPDLILSDMHMPRLSGRELLAAVRGDVRLAHTRFAFLTGEAQSVVGAEADVAQADGFLSKPFSRDQLLALLKSLAF